MDVFSLAVGAGAALAGRELVRRMNEHPPEVPDASRTRIPLGDRLNWLAMVDDGVVMNKDAAFLAAWRYRGPDLSSATIGEVNHLKRQVNAALLPLGSGWMYHSDAIRQRSTRYMTPGAFPDPTTALIDDERRAVFERGGDKYETECFFALTYVSPRELYSRAGKLFVEGEHRVVSWDRLLGQFGEVRTRLQAGLAGAGLKMERLGADDLLAYLHTCVTGLHHPVRTPPDKAQLDAMLGEQELWGGFEPQIGDLHVRPIEVMGYPLESYAGILDVLNRLPHAYRWSNRFIPLDREIAGKKIRTQQLTWFKKRKGAGAWMQEMTGGAKTEQARRDQEMFLDQDAKRMAEEISDALADNESGRARFGYYTSTILVMERDPEQAEFTAGEIVNTLQDHGFPAAVARVNAMDAYFGTLPGHGVPNLRRPMLSSRNVAAFLPTTSVWPGLEFNPSPLFPKRSPAVLRGVTDGSTPFWFNMHDSDVGHTLLLGPTGAGKSTFLNLIVAQFLRYPGARVRQFDVGYSSYLLAKAAGAKHYDIAAGRVDAIGFQPLADIDQPGQRAWAAEWLDTLFAVNDVRITPRQKTLIERGLELLASNQREYRTLTALLPQLPDETLQSVLRYYTVSGPLGLLLDSSRDDLTNDDWSVFEIKHLLELTDKVSVPVLGHLFRGVERGLQKGFPTFISTDEAWLAMLKQMFGERVVKWLVGIRKENGNLLLATQSLSQFAVSPHFHVILESCPTKIFLPNPEARSEEIARLYAQFGLNAREIGIVADARPKRDYYFKSPRGTRLFELGLGPAALAFLSTREGWSMQDTIRHADALIERHGSEWPGVWLRESGLHQQAERFYHFQGEYSHASEPLLQAAV